MQSEEEEGEEEEVDGARETTQVEAVVEVYILKGLKGLFSFLFADESFFFFFSVFWECLKEKMGASWGKRGEEKKVEMSRWKNIMGAKSGFICHPAET